MPPAGLLRGVWSQGVRAPPHRGSSVRCSSAADGSAVQRGPCPPARLLASRRAPITCTATRGVVAAAATSVDDKSDSAAGVGIDSIDSTKAQASAGAGSDEADGKKKKQKPRPKRPAADQPWRPSRLRPAKPRFKTEEEAVAAAAADEERRLFREQRRALAGSGSGGAEPTAATARQEWYALKCLPEKERYSAERIRNLMMSMGLEDSTQVYVARRQTLGDVLARFSNSAAASGTKAAPPSAASDSPSDALSATGLPINGGAVITEGMVLLRAVMTPALTAALEEERSVLGFLGAMAPGTTLGRARETSKLALTPVPMDGPSLRVYADGVTQAPDELAVARTGPACLVALPGGAFQLVTQNKRPAGESCGGEGGDAPMSLRHVMAAQQPAEQPLASAPGGGGERWRAQLQQARAGAPSVGARTRSDSRHSRPPAGGGAQGGDGDV